MVWNTWPEVLLKKWGWGCWMHREVKVQATLNMDLVIIPEGVIGQLQVLEVVVTKSFVHQLQHLYS